MRVYTCVSVGVDMQLSDVEKEGGQPCSAMAVEILSMGTLLFLALLEEFFRLFKRRQTPFCPASELSSPPPRVFFSTEGFLSIAVILTKN